MSLSKINKRMVNKQVVNLIISISLLRFKSFYNYNILYLFSGMEQVNIREIKELDIGQKEIQTQKKQNQQHVEKNEAKLEVQQFIQKCTSNPELGFLKQRIKQLEDQLTAKEAKIIQNQTNRQQLQSRMNVQKEELKQNMLSQFNQRQKKVTQHLEYIKKAEQNRQIAFKKMREFINQSNCTILSHQRQLKQTIKITELKNQLALLQQQKNTLQFKNNHLQQRISAIEKDNQTKDELLSQYNKKLEDLKAYYQSSQQQSIKKFKLLEQSNKEIEKSFSRQIASSKQAHKSEFQIKLSQAKKKYEQTIGKRISTQRFLCEQKQRLTKDILALQHQFDYQRQAAQKLKKAKKSTDDQISMLQQQNKVLQKRVDQLQSEKDKQFYQITEMKKDYEEKSQKLKKQFGILKKKCQEQWKHQKNIMRSDYESKIKQTNFAYKDVIEPKIREGEALKKQVQQLQNLNKIFQGELQTKKSEIEQLTAIIQQCKNILTKWRPQVARVTNRRSISIQLQRLIDNLKTAQQKSSEYLKIAEQKLKYLTQICAMNKNLLKGKSMTREPLTSWQRFPEEKDNPNHLGSQLNKFLDKIRAYIVQEQKTQKEQSEQLASLKNNNVQLTKNMKITQLELQQIRPKINNLYFQNRNLLNQNQTFKNVIETLKMQKAKQAQIQNELNMDIIKLNAQLQIARSDLNEQIVDNKQLKQQVAKIKRQQQVRLEELQEQRNKLYHELQFMNKQFQIEKQLTKRLNNNIKQSQEKIKTRQLKINFLQAENHKLRSQMEQKQRLLKDQIENQTNKISTSLEEIFESKLQSKSTDDIISFLRYHGNSSPSNTSFTVSEILQKMSKERTFLMQECCKFFGVKYISTKLAYKYDQHSKNFSVYLPTHQNKFIFAIIFKTKRNVVFGLISSSIGHDSKAIAFNLDTKKIMGKSQRSRLSSTNYQSSMLKFGNEEIIVKNNSTLQIKINTMIIGERYFEFSKQDLVGKGQVGETVQLSAFEIHKIMVAS